MNDYPINSIQKYHYDSYKINNDYQKKILSFPSLSQINKLGKQEEFLTFKYKENDIQSLLNKFSLKKIAVELPVQTEPSPPKVDSLVLRHGPNSKSLFTYELELVTLCLLQRPDKINYTIVDKQIIADFGSFRVNISKLLRRAELRHFRLPRTSHSSDVTPEERAFISRFSGDGFEGINKLLYQNQGNKENFLSSMQLLSVINRLEPETSVCKSYRGEAFTPDQETAFRKLLVQTGGGVTTQKAFMSSSRDEKLDCFKDRKVVIIFDLPHGKDIAKFSYHPDEAELLIPPCQIHWMRHYSLTKDIFHAKVVAPLTSGRDKVTPAEIAEFQKLYAWAEAEGIDQRDAIVFDKGVDTFSVPLLFSTKPQGNDFKLFVSALIPAILDVCPLLSRPYTNPAYTCDWELKTSFGTIQRPNHNIVNAVRSAALITQVAEYLQRFSFEQVRFTFTKSEIRKMQLAALFSSVGRENDGAFSDNRALYQTFRKASADAFRAYVSQYYPLEMSQDEMMEYSDLVLKMGRPEERSSKFMVLNFAHKLDLVRCYTTPQLKESVIDPLNHYLPEERTTELLDYAVQLHIATGDRICSHGPIRTYIEPIFYKASTDAAFCLERICSVTPPTSHLIAPNQEQQHQVILHKKP